MSVQTSSMSTPAACFRASPCLINSSLISKPTHREAPALLTEISSLALLQLI